MVFIVEIAYLSQNDSVAAYEGLQEILYNQCYTRGDISGINQPLDDSALDR